MRDCENNQQELEARELSEKEERNKVFREEIRAKTTEAYNEMLSELAEARKLK